MERNAQAKRERILKAAFAEFAAKGLAGGRVDSIATAAGCNKSLIFLHFGSKENLFESVVQAQLADAEEQVKFNPRDLRASSKRMVTFATKNPDAVRLLAWHSLERRCASSAKSPECPNEEQGAWPTCRTEEGRHLFLLPAIAVLCMRLGQRGALHYDPSYRNGSKATPELAG